MSEIGQELIRRLRDFANRVACDPDAIEMELRRIECRTATQGDTINMVDRFRRTRLELAQARQETAKLREELAGRDSDMERLMAEMAEITDDDLERVRDEWREVRRRRMEHAAEIAANDPLYGGAEKQEATE